MGDDRLNYHTPVMLEEALEALRCKPGGLYVDGTIGGAGHAYEILRRTSPDGRLIGFDLDEDALREAAGRLASFGERAVLVRGNFADADAVLKERGIGEIDGALLDLGVSSHQLTSPERGFSFSADSPLDMRMDKRQRMTAFTVVNSLPQDDVERILRQGEETAARKVAAAIVERRGRSPIRTTGELAALVVSAVPGHRRRQRIHPATKTFQAIRIHVNAELASLENAIPGIAAVIKPGGRFVIISFHSLEDRIAKQTFRELERGCTCPRQVPYCICGKKPLLRVLTRKPILPSQDEVSRNPRARSAKMRVAERIRS
ncbi:MAG: Ribosomal RNA small subunit methyltransferase H [Syntrophaceae bacterium PtaU1.Bin231]|nr:MAG: Ribosomal RNA small subunit methyltransferase H [Syntrophaceae bacterium PtaU1.Bin231]HOG17212.1 16S rRNA (cytosine(1402)-N(4))-methyltransferase RsmH [Syntrophales bacterium]